MRTGHIGVVGPRLSIHFLRICFRSMRICRGAKLQGSSNSNWLVSRKSFLKVSVASVLVDFVLQKVQSDQWLTNGLGSQPYTYLTETL